MVNNYFNPDGDDILNEKIFGSKPTGFIDFNRPKYKWAKSIYELMEACTWFPSEVNTATEKKSFEQLTDNEKEIYKYVFAQLSFNDSAQSFYLTDFTKATTNSIIKSALILQSYQEVNHCYIDGTEVLTDKGFKNFRDLTFEDKVANYNEDGTIHFTNPKDIIKSRYKGTMYRFKQHNYEQVVTPNHRMVMKYPEYQREKDANLAGKLRIEFAEYASLRNYNLPVAGKAIGNKKELSLIERIAIAFQADGSFMNVDKYKGPNKTKNGYAYVFRFKREDKIERMRWLLRFSALSYSETQNSEGYSCFYIWTDYLFDKDFDWVNLEEINYEYGQEFLNELKYWDGSKGSNDSILYTNSNRKAIDKVVAIAAISGAQTGIYHIEPETSNGNNLIDAWQVHIVPNKSMKTGRGIEKTSFDYNGMIYCCTVDSGMLICRYNESVFISGNSRSYAVLLDAAGNSSEVFDLYKRDNALRRKNERISEHFAKYIKDAPYSSDKMLLSSMASVNLEGIYFLLGFAYIFVLGDKVPGARDMIKFISRDELQNHITLFANIFRTIRRENKIDTKLLDSVNGMITEAVDIELEYGNYLLENFPIMGITKELMEQTVYNYANERLRKIGLTPIFKSGDATYLQKLVEKNSRFNDVKTNFFEGNVTNYAKSTISFDDI